MDEAQYRLIARQEALQQVATVAGFMLERLRNTAAARPIERAAIVEILEELLAPACPGWPPWDGTPPPPP